MRKRLYRSRKNRVLLGVLGGMADYFKIDPVILRVVFVILLIITGIFPLGIVYLIAALIIPEEPR